MRRKVPPPKWPRASHLTLVSIQPQTKTIGVSLWLKVSAVVILVAFFMLAGTAFLAELLDSMAKAALR